jgi:hypothetical protein
MEEESSTLTREQARWLGLYVARIDGAATVDLRRSSSGVLAVTVYDRTGERIAAGTAAARTSAAPVSHSGVMDLGLELAVARDRGWA